MENQQAKAPKRRKSIFGSVLIFILAFLVVRTDFFLSMFTTPTLADQMEKKYHEKFVYEKNQSFNNISWAVLHPARKPELKVHARSDGFDLHDDYVASLTAFKIRTLAEPIMVCEAGQRIFCEYRNSITAWRNCVNLKSWI